MSMGTENTVDLYVDFISPYAWLALMRAASFQERHGVRFEMRPVVYAALLDHHRLVGPGEVEGKRRYTFEDVARCALREGLRLAGPPAHPFRSLEALRVYFLYRSDPGAVALAAALADACWGEGRDLTDPEVLAHVVAGQGLDAGDLMERIADPAVKQGLRSLTEEAIAEGVFGVPTFVHAGELFWGHDRMEHLAERLAGSLPSGAEAGRAIAARRGSARRRGAPGPDGREAGRA